MLTPEDRAAIGELLADYGHVVDDHDWDRAHEVFAEDFVFDRSATGRPDLHGIADIVANFKGRNMYAHVTTNTTLTEVDGDTVRGHSKFLGFPNEGQPVTGDYHDEIVRTPAGWRLRRRRAEIRERKFFD
ncbi:MAG: nuclear transport factor 2 family protein [Pseudonocardia sediminis]